MILNKDDPSARLKRFVELHLGLHNTEFDVSSSRLVLEAMRRSLGFCTNLEKLVLDFDHLRFDLSRAQLVNLTCIPQYIYDCHFPRLHHIKLRRVLLFLKDASSRSCKHTATP